MPCSAELLRSRVSVCVGGEPRVTRTTQRDGEAVRPQWWTGECGSVAGSPRVLYVQLGITYRARWVSCAEVTRV